jgi:hypothetical protein
VDNKKRKILAVGQILPGVFEDITRSGSHEPNEQIQLEKIWADIASAITGPADVAGISLSGFKEGTIYIAVDHTARLFYWKLRRGAVLKRFQERRPDVKNIVFKIGKVT